MKRKFAIVLIMVMILNVFANCTSVFANESEIITGNPYDVDVRIDSEWEQGYNVTVTINNISEKPIDNWYLSFETSDDIQNLQCGNIIHNENGEYLVKNAGWNKDIPVGGNVYFTYTALKSGESADIPDEFTMNTALLDVPAESFVSEFTIQSDWGTGFTGVLSIKNVSSETINDWKLYFKFDGTIESLTGGELATFEDGSYEVNAYSYDQGIAPNGVVNIQIVGSRANSETVPYDVTLKTVDYYIAPEVPEEIGSSVVIDFSGEEAEIEKIRAINNGELPEMYLDEEDEIPMAILGKYSDVIVTDAESAIASLKDITHLMCINWDTITFEVVSVQSYGGFAHYKLQEYYNGLEVSGKQLIVSTDEQGNITGLSGDFDPITETNTEVVVSEADARVLALEILGTDNFPSKLVWYSVEAGYDEPAWYFESSKHCVYVSAIYGDELWSYSLIPNTADVSGELAEDYSVDDEALCYIHDKERKIQVYNARGKHSKSEEVTTPYPYGENVEDNYCGEIGQMLLNFTVNTYEYYKKMFNLSGICGNPESAYDIKVAYNVVYDTTENNADANIYPNGLSVITIDQKRAQNTTQDMITHEYTHLIEQKISNLVTANETGALKEAIADIMAELMDCSNGDYSWDYPDRKLGEGLNRDDTPLPTVYLGEYYDEYYIKKHANSYVITHCIMELMSEGYADCDVMAVLMYRSLFHMNENAKFKEFRAAFIMAARELGLDVQMIKDVFDKAGIIVEEYVPSASTKNYTITVVDSVTEEPIYNAKILIMANGSNTIVTRYTDVNGMVVITSGKSVTINVIKTGYNSEIVELNSISTDVCIGLTRDSENRVSKVYGTIRDSQSDALLAGAEIRFRTGINNTNGRYLTDGNGNVLLAKSNEVGTFSSPALQPGVYTMEIKNQGYIAEYEVVTVIPGGSEGINMGNIYISKRMTFDMYRIVLHWNENPRDLDAHLVCYDNITNKYLYHVYFANKRWSGLVYLDRDDTNGTGPEVMRFKADKDKRYIYYVNWFSGSGTWKTSGARVEIYAGNKKVKELSVTESLPNGRIWDVCIVENGKLYVNMD